MLSCLDTICDQSWATVCNTNNFIFGTRLLLESERGVWSNGRFLWFTWTRNWIGLWTSNANLKYIYNWYGWLAKFCGGNHVSESFSPWKSRKYQFQMLLTFSLKAPGRNLPHQTWAAPTWVAFHIIYGNGFVVCVSLHTCVFSFKSYLVMGVRGLFCFAYVRVSVCVFSFSSYLVTICGLCCFKYVCLFVYLVLHHIW